MTRPLPDYELAVLAQIGGAPAAYGTAVYGRDTYQGQIAPWVDLACEVVSVDITRGMRPDRGVVVRPVAGTCGLTLHDPAGRLDPTNPAGPFYGRLAVGTPVRLAAVADLDGTETTIFTGTARQWAHSGGVADVEVVDAVQTMATWPVETTLPAQPAGARISALLALLPVEQPAVVNGVGRPLGPAEFTGTVWDAIQATTLDELGLTLVDRDGILHWQDFAGAWQWPTRPYPTVACHPDPARPELALYSELAASTDDGVIVNECLARRLNPDGTPAGTVTVSDTASRLAHGPAGIVADLRVADDPTLAGWAQDQISHTAWPIPRVQSITVEVRPALPRAHLAANEHLVLDVEAGDYLTVRRHAGGEQHVRVYEIRHRIVGGSWRADYSLGQPWDDTQSVYGLARYGSGIYAGSVL